MLIKPFSILFKDQVSDTAMSYLGVVEDNNDPKKLGRLKVRVAPYSDLETEELPWAYPKLGTHGNSAEYGGLNVPEIGSQVRVEFPSRDLTAPYYSGAELNETNRTTFFDEDYPNTYGYKDSVGNFVRINKERGTAHFQHYTSTNAQVAPDGSMKITLSNGAYFTFDNSNNFELNIGTLSLNGTSDGTFNINANNDVNINTSKVDINGSLHVTGDVCFDVGTSGTFLALGRKIEVKNGLIIAIKP